MNGNRKSNKQTESIIVAIIMILVLALVVLAGIYIVTNFNRSRNRGFGGGGGGGGMVPPTHTQSVSIPTVMPTPEIIVQTPAPTPTVTPVPTPVVTYSPAPNLNYGHLEKKNEFLNKAAEIRAYSEMYYESSMTQYELNTESAVVYKKWDDLLNEVYQYLKIILSDTEFKKLQKDEIEWIKKKENAIQAAGAEWAGGSGEPMARNSVGIQYTEERCYYLISLIN